MKWVDEHNGKRKVDVVDVLSVGGAVDRAGGESRASSTGKPT
jgi:hypothetical protein